MDNDGWYREYQAMKHKVVNASAEISRLEDKLHNLNMHYEILQGRCEDRMIKLHEIGKVINSIDPLKMTETEKKIQEIFQDWSDTQKRRNNLERRNDLERPISEQFT